MKKPSPYRLTILKELNILIQPTFHTTVSLNIEAQLQLQDLNVTFYINFRQKIKKFCGEQSLAK
jgi:hypothetical protein